MTGWFRLLPSVALAGVVLACAGCAAAISGQPQGVPIPVESAAQVVRQAIDNLSEAAVLHLTGTLTNKDNDQLGIDFTETASGELTGTVSLDGQQAQVADLSGRLYVNGAQGFWSAIADLPSGSDSAAAGNWVTVTTDLLGVDPTIDLTPAAIGSALAQAVNQPNTTPFAKLATTQHNGLSAVRFNPNEQDSSTDLMVSAAAPHGIVHVDLPAGGVSSHLSADVADVSSTAPAVYQALSQQAAALQSAIDPDLDINQGQQTWGPCNAGGCSVNVTFTNSSSVSTKVLVTGNWTGDNSPVGSCQVVSDPVAAGASGTATCTVNTPQWTAFYHRAQSVPGTHPYELRWAAFALAEPPNQQTIDTVATEAGTPAKPSSDTASGTGGDYVYRIDYQDTGGRTRVWKFGATNLGSWQNYANTQAGDCLAEQRTSCSVSLVGRAANLITANALVAQQVNVAKAGAGQHCPPGQWAYCG